VNYDTSNWMALIKQLNDDHAVIHVLNRAQLIDDAFALARAGQLDYSMTLCLSKFLKKEDNVTPFYSAMHGFSYLLGRMRRNREAYKKFKVNKLPEQQKKHDKFYGNVFRMHFINFINKMFKHRSERQKYSQIIIIFLMY